MASQPPPYGPGPQPGQPYPGQAHPGQVYPGQQYPGPAVVPGYGGGPGFGPPAPPGPGVGPGGGQPPRPRRGMGALWIVLGAVVVAALVAGAIVLIGGRDSDDEADTTTTERSRRTTTTTEEEPTDPPTTTAPATTAPPTTAPPTTPPPTEPTTPPTTAYTPPEGAIDIGNGVYLPLPEGWTREDDENDAVVEITNGTLIIDAQALQRDVGEAPQDVFQEYIDLFDGDFSRVAYSPATQRATYADGTLRIVGLYYRAVDDDLSGFDGAVYVWQRADGLTVVLDYYEPKDAGPMGLPDDDYDALLASVLAAPPLGDPGTLGDVAPFRITSVHPSLLLDGLIGFTPAPGWVAQDAPGAVAANNGLDETVIATKLTGQPDAASAAAAAQADFASRFPGFTFDPTEPGDASGNLQRLDIPVYAAADPAIDARPRTGRIILWWDPASGSAVTFGRFWYADVNSDASDPNFEAVNFMLTQFADSFGTTIP